jgi:hypothetical protein
MLAAQYKHSACMLLKDTARSFAAVYVNSIQTHWLHCDEEMKTQQVRSAQQFCLHTVAGGCWDF